MKALLLIDHGSQRSEANEMLACMAALLQAMVGSDIVVRFAHMEIAEPSIGRGVDACIEAGATEIIAFPYMLSPGRHSTADIPRLVAEAARPHAGVAVRVTQAFGIDAQLGEVILRRAGIAVVGPRHGGTNGECWQPEGHTGACGDACPASGTGAPAGESRSRSSAAMSGPRTAPPARAGRDA